MANDQPGQEDASLEALAARLGFTVDQKTGTTFIVGGPKRDEKVKSSKAASESEAEAEDD
jgi:hypothetical protein